MRSRLLAVVFLLAGSAAAQQGRKLVINAETPEGQVLQQVGQETDEAKKLQLMEQFLTQYPKHEAAIWVYEQIQPLYIKTGQYDKAIDAGEKALAIDSGDLDVAYNNLKAAEAKKDAALVKKWSGNTSQLAKKVVAAGAQDDEGKQRADYAKQVDTYTEYSLYATALQTADPLSVIDLVDTLETRNPQSQYLPKVYSKYLTSLAQQGNAEKTGAAAEKIARLDPANEDALLMAADYYQRRKENAKALNYATKLTEVLSSKAKPEGMTDEGWTQKKNNMLGVGYYMTGAIYASGNNYSQADKALRAALPNIRDNQMLAIATFYLGLSDYKLAQSSKNKAQIRDALKYSEQSAGIRSPVQSQAAANVRAIRAELGGAAPARSAR